MTKHKHANLLIAYANNSSLKFQCRIDGSSGWVTVTCPVFTDAPDVEWRIKPEPKKAYVFMNRKESSNSGWFSNSYDTREEAQLHWEQMLKFGYDSTDIKEVEFV